jgi:Apea-like HEPN
MKFTEYLFINMRKIYALFRNVDESILKLNQYMTGYQFVKFDLSEVEKEFYQLFGLPKDFTAQQFISFDGKELTKDFYDAIINSHLTEWDVLERGYMIFLEICELEQDENEQIKTDNSRQNLSTTFEYVNHLVKCLRLIFSGYVAATTIFEINLSNKHIFSKISDGLNLIREKNLDIDESKFEQFDNLIKKSFPDINDLSLAVENFDTSYRIEDKRVRFIILITALESILNFGRDQIAHTIARHSSLLISNTKQEFHDNYSRIKKLYNERSSLVHGSGEKNTLQDTDIDFAEELVRIAIVFWINKGTNKKQLFDYFNALGYPEENFWCDRM